ncbi:hypothetical protein GQ53DRAFT_830244 [Thozetella sp. PMI_491]|nr:hypothetical protein GQ53DRAFT_830244 [Thozetella sp. PMI_491]
MENPLGEKNKSVPVRARAAHKKLRTGCRTCKARHIKCDEAKPACVRCTSTGRGCDGYEAKARHSWTATTVVPPALITTIPSQETESNPRFHYFRAVTAPEFSRFFGRSFWSRSILQASHEFAAVRHAVQALAILHRQHKESTPFDYSGTREYSQAMRQLIRDISKNKVKLVALLCGVLFACIEVLQEDDPSAVKHLDGVIKLLNESTATEKPLLEERVLTDMEEEILMIVESFDLEASIASIPRPPQLRLRTLTTEGGLSAYNLGEPMTIERAARELNEIMRHIYHLVRSDSKYCRRIDETAGIPLEVVRTSQQLAESLKIWHTKNTSLRPSSETQVSDRTALVWIHYHTAVTILSGCIYAEETIYDSYLEAFREIVRLATLVSRPSGTSSETTFISETGVMFPLYWTAIKCRDGRLRRAAIYQMSIGSREGVWIPEIYTAVARRVVEIEETNLRGFKDGGAFPSAGDIMENWRIHSVGLDLYKQKREARMVYQMLLGGLEGEWHVASEFVCY